MKPLLREGDAVLVAHGRKDVRRGDVVVFRQEGGLVAHRVLRIGRGDTGCALVTKGDSLRRFDAPISAKQVVGRVVSIERNGRQMRLDTPGWRAVGWLVAGATLAGAVVYRRVRALMRWVGLENG
jgi:signal peptidase